MTLQEMLAIEEWLYRPLAAREFANIIENALSGIPPNQLQSVHFGHWMPWVYWKAASLDGIVDLQEAQRVLRGDDWTLNLTSGLRRKSEGLSAAEKRSKGWLGLMRDQAHYFASQDPDGEVTTDPLRRWADLHNIQPLHPNHWGSVFKEGSGFTFTGRYKKSEYVTNNARDIKIWHSVKVAANRPRHLRSVP